MRILSISHTYPLNWESGSTLRIWNVARRMAARHELRLLSSGKADRPMDPDDVPEWLESLPSENGRVPSLRLRLRRQLRSLSVGVPPSVQAHRSPALARRVRDLVRDGWPQVVIAEEDSAAVELALVPPSIPRILVKHSVHALEIEERARRTPLPRRFASWLEMISARRYEQRGIRTATALVMVCDEDRRELAERYGAFDAVVVPNGCAEPERLWSDPGRLRVGVLADFRWQPNRWELSWFLEQVRPRLIRHVPSVEIDIIGHFPDPPLRDPSMPNVRWLGRVEDLFATLRSCSVLALPVRYGSGIRNRLLDGLALGMPIVTTPLGIRGVEIEPGVEADVASTAQEFSDRLAELLADPEARARRHRAALLLAKKMTWEASLERLDGLLERLVAG